MASPSRSILLTIAIRSESVLKCPLVLRNTFKSLWVIRPPFWESMVLKAINGVKLGFCFSSSRIALRLHIKAISQRTNLQKATSMSVLTFLLDPVYISYWVTFSLRSMLFSGRVNFKKSSKSRLPFSWLSNDVRREAHSYKEASL